VKLPRQRELGAPSHGSRQIVRLPRMSRQLRAHQGSLNRRAHACVRTALGTRPAVHLQASLLPSVRMRVLGRPSRRVLGGLLATSRHRPPTTAG
jgi:hypothetical protein